MSDRWGEGTVQRYDGDQVTVLFDEHGYRDLLVPLVVERGLLRQSERECVDRADGSGRGRPADTLSERLSNRGAGMAENDPSPSMRDVHVALNQPATDPDQTAWPDPYDKRPDPRDPAADADRMDFGDVHTPTGATSTSDPQPEADVEVDPRKANPHELRRRERRRARLASPA